MPCGYGKTRFLLRILQSLRRESENGRILPDVHTPGEDIYRAWFFGLDQAVKKPIIGVCGSWSPATFGMWTFTQVRVLSPRQGNKQHDLFKKPLPLVSWVRIPHLLTRVGGVVKRDSLKNTFPGNLVAPNGSRAPLSASSILQGTWFDSRYRLDTATKGLLRV